VFCDLLDLGLAHPSTNLPSWVPPRWTADHISSTVGTPGRGVRIIYIDRDGVPQDRCRSNGALRQPAASTTSISRLRCLDKIAFVPRISSGISRTKARRKKRTIYVIKASKAKAYTDICMDMQDKRQSKILPSRGHTWVHHACTMSPRTDLHGLRWLCRNRWTVLLDPIPLLFGTSHASRSQ